MTLSTGALIGRVVRRGTAGQLDVLDAEPLLLVARQALVQAQWARRLNSVQLYRMLGGVARPAVTGGVR